MTPDDVTSRSGGFLHSITSRGLPYGVCALARYDVATFHPALYDVFGLVRPPNIAEAVRKRQAEFLAGRLIASIAMGKTHALPIGTDRGPVWPVGLSGSITHSYGYCAALVMDDSLLCGIDLERIATGSACDAILQGCVSDQERSWIEGHGTIGKDALATLTFSAKECIFKSLSPVVGKFFGFECAEIVGLTEGATVNMRLTENLDHNFPKGLNISVSYEFLADFVLTYIQMPRPVNA